MSHLFWVLITVFAICYVLCILGVAVAFDEDDRREAVGAVIAGGALLYILGVLLGIAP